jgi:hypothetical protein
MVFLLKKIAVGELKLVAERGSPTTVYYRSSDELIAL